MSASTGIRNNRPTNQGSLIPVPVRREPREARQARPLRSNIPVPSKRIKRGRLGWEDPLLKDGKSMKAGFDDSDLEIFDQVTF